MSVFLDTNIFVSCKYDFGSDGVLELLKNLTVQNKVKLFVSDIVVRETMKHIMADIDEAISNFKRARKSISSTLSTSIVKDTHLAEIFELPLKSEVQDNALSNFKEYLNSTKATILDSSGISIESILNDYFNGEAPFEQNENKKHEFPDAIIAAKLRIEFSEMKPLFIISGDNGFKMSFSDVPGFVCLKTVKEILDIINRQDEMYNTIIQFLNDSNSHKIVTEYINQILEATDIEVDGMNCDRKGLCDGYDYEYTMITSISDIDFVLSSVDEINDSSVLVTLSCKSKISALCTFNDYENSMWDSEEEEYIFLTTGEVEEEHEPSFECSLELSVSQVDDSIHFGIINASIDIELDPNSRVSQSFINPEDIEWSAKCEMADALEDFYKH